MNIAKAKALREANKVIKPKQGVSYIDPATADYMAKAMGVRDIKGDGLDINLVKPENRFKPTLAGFYASLAKPYPRRGIEKSYGVPLKPALYTDALTRFKRGNGAVYLDSRARNAEDRKSVV